MKYPSTLKFADFVKELKYNGQGSSVTLRGVPKIDGTNAGVTFWYNKSTTGLGSFSSAPQSRLNLLVDGADNFGFAAWYNRPSIKMVFADVHTAAWGLISGMSPELRGDPSFRKYEAGDVCFQCFGEWCGAGGIAAHKNMSISKIGKTVFLPFAARFKVNVDAAEDENFWLSHEEMSRIWAYVLSMEIHEGVRDEFINPDEVPIWFQDIHQLNPGLASERLEQITLQAEAQCPIARSLYGVEEGYGEGLVWWLSLNGSLPQTLIARYRQQGLRFKTKGPRTSVVKEKKVAPVDPEKLENKAAFIEYACTPNRLRQIMSQHIQEHFVNKGIATTPEMLIRTTRDFVQSFSGDVIKEEGHRLTELSLTPQDVGSDISRIAREFMEMNCGK